MWKVYWGKGAEREGETETDLLRERGSRQGLSLKGTFDLCTEPGYCLPCAQVAHSARAPRPGL